MPDDPFSATERDQDEFFRGLNFLGRPSSLTLPGQEPSPPGGALSAGAAPPAAPSSTGAPGESAGVGSPAFGLSPGLQRLMTGLSFAERASNLGGLLGAGGAGAITTPSGQLTTGAPEILRDIQYPSSEISQAGQALGTQGIDSSLFGDLGGYLSTAAPYLAGAGSIFDIIQALRAGNPSGIVGPIGELGVLGAGQLGLIPSATVATEAGLEAGSLAAGLASGIGTGTIAGGVGILAAIIADMIQDPKGRVSAAEDVNILTQQQLPGDIGALQASQAILPFVSNPANLSGLSNEQIIQLYATAAGGMRAAGNLSGPLSTQGQEEYGIHHPHLPGLGDLVGQTTPQAWLATLRLSDELARRGIDPSAVTIGASGDPTGAYRLAQEQLALEMFGGPSQDAEANARGMAMQDAYQQFVNQSIWMDPAALLAQTGLLPEQNIIGQPGATGTPDQGYLFSPGVMQQLAGIHPGGYEAGLQTMLRGLPGYGDSPYAALFTRPTTMAQVVGPGGALSAGGFGGEAPGDVGAASFGAGTIFPFEQA